MIFQILKIIVCIVCFALGFSTIWYVNREGVSFIRKDKITYIVSAAIVIVAGTILAFSFF